MKQEDVRVGILQLLSRHRVVFGDYTWMQFDDEFLARNVNSVSIVDTDLTIKEKQVRAKVNTSNNFVCKIE